MHRIMGLLGLLSLSAFVSADETWYGTWVERTAKPQTMIVEESGGGTKISYHMPAGSGMNFVMSFVTQMDGEEVPVMIDGKPTNEMMTVKRIDDRHTTGSWRFQGVLAGTSKSELSADGKVLKVESDNAASGASGMPGKITQYWDKQ